MKELPYWHLTNKFPSFVDADSKTVIEQTAKLYGAIQELIIEHNSFIDTMTKTINEYKLGSYEEFECFKDYINTITERYIKTVDAKICMMDKEISDFAKGITDSLPSIVESKVDEKLANLPTGGTKLYRNHINCFDDVDYSTLQSFDFLSYTPLNFRNTEEFYSFVMKFSSRSDDLPLVGDIYNYTQRVTIITRCGEHEFSVTTLTAYGADNNFNISTKNITHTCEEV